MITPFIVAACCLFMEMFFACSEISIISCDQIALRREAEAGQRAARLLINFLANKQRFLATTLFGTQLAVVVSTIVMTYALHQHYPHRAELYLMLGLSPTTILFGEVFPKTLGRQHSDRMARLLVFPLWLASTLFAPLLWLFTTLTTRVIAAFGIPERKLVTREELELLLLRPAESDKGRGEISEGERKMISRIFEFTDKTSGDVMVPLSDVVALSEETSLAEAAREVEDKQYTRYPVYRERIDCIVGTVHAFDLLKAQRSEQSIGTLARPPLFVPRSQPAVDLLVELQRAHQGMAVVVDEYGGAVGLCTVEDILEEIVGDIEDEHDESSPAMRKLDEGLWRISARLRVSEVNQKLRLELPEGEEYETIAGLLLDRLKHIPRENESIRHGQVVLKVTRASERAVEEVEVRVTKRRG